MRFSVVVFSILLIALTGCEKSPYVVKNESDIVILGHGGMGISGNYPMNSFESISYALSLGADGCEIDVEMTRDSVVVLYHDSDLSSQTNLQGKIYQQNWADIQHATYTRTPYSQYRLIDFDRLLNGLGEQKNKLLVLDYKGYNPDTSAETCRRICRAILRVADKHQVAGNIMVEFKNENLAKAMQQFRPEIPVFIYADFDLAFGIAKRNKLAGIVNMVEKISAGQVELAHQNHLKVIMLNNMTTSGNKEAIRKKADYIETDNLYDLLKWLR